MKCPDNFAVASFNPEKNMSRSPSVNQSDSQKQSDPLSVSGGAADRAFCSRSVNIDVTQSMQSVARQAGRQAFRQQQS